MLLRDNAPRIIEPLGVFAVPLLPHHTSSSVARGYVRRQEFLPFPDGGFGTCDDFIRAIVEPAPRFYDDHRSGDYTMAAAPSTLEMTPQEIARYSRHLIMPEVAMQGQKRLKAARVLLIGAGGLGSPLGLYLAAAGVGHLGIVDFDVVDFSNLQRQVLHTTHDIGRQKLESAKEHLSAINPEVEITTYETRLTAANALQLLEPFDIVIDGTDNFPTRYLVNDACVLL